MAKTRKEIMDELAVAKMQKITEEILSGKRKVFTLADIKKKYPDVFE
ncbi:MAG: hypothetical protein AB1657_00255 [Candidatus Micrarchaeota archaeon]